MHCIGKVYFWVPYFITVVVAICACGNDERGIGVDAAGVDAASCISGEELGPVTVTSFVNGGGGFSCVIVEGGRVKCWGYNSSYLGIETMDNRGDEGGEMADNLPFVNLGEDFVVKKLAVGWNHACAVSTLGQLKCWGDNSSGQLGLGNDSARGGMDGDMGDSSPRVYLGSGVLVRDVAAGYERTCVITEQGKLKCWGDNRFGQLGIGTVGGNLGTKFLDMGDNVPNIDLGIGRTAKSVAMGRNHACVILDNDLVKCWGDTLCRSRTYRGW